MQTKAEQDQVTAQKLHDLGVPACINRFRPEVQAALAGPAPTKKPLTAIAAEIETQPTKEAMEEQRKLKSRGRVGKMLATKNDREAAASGKTWDAATAKWIDPDQPKGDTTVKHQDGPKAQATRALREAKAAGAAPALAAKKDKATNALATASEKAKEPPKAKKTPAKAAGKLAGKPKRTQAAKAAQAKRTAPVAPPGRRNYDWIGAEEAAKKGKMPPKLDFSAETHASYRGKLAEIEALAKAKDAAALKKMDIPTYCTSCRAMARWRDMAVSAIGNGG